MPDLAAFPVITRITVLWSDLDAYGHVNNAVLFRYFEQARMEYLAQVRFIESYEKDKIGAILHSTSCWFGSRSSILIPSRSGPA